MLSNHIQRCRMRCISISALLLISGSCYAELPISFISSTSINDLAIGQTQTLNYTIRNNVRGRTLPLRSIQVINDGDNQPSQVTTLTTTCGSTLAYNATCSISVVIANATANINRHLSINYGGRSPLTSPIKSKISKAKYTVLVYIIGSDLQTDHNFANFNIAQMEQVGSTSNMNIILETGGSRSPGYQTVQRKIVYKGKTQQLADLGSLAMGSPGVIKDFLQWGITNYPAEKYITIFWDHGGGPNGGYGGADIPPAPGKIAINDLSKVVGEVAGGISHFFEIIGFDACLMASAETLASYSGYAKYFIASEDLEPGKGWQYNTFLKYIDEHPTATGEDIGKVIIDGYTEQNNTGSTTLSLSDLSEVMNLNTALTHFATALDTYLTNDESWMTIAKSRFKSADYSTSVWDNKSVDVVDLVEFAQRIGTAIPSLNDTAQAVINAVDKAVLYLKNSADRADSYGLTSYFPSIMAEYETIYPDVTQIDGVYFFSSTYVGFVQRYRNYYINNISSLKAILADTTFDGTNYLSTVTNTFNELYAAVGNENCVNLTDNRNSPVTNVPCYTSNQSTGIEVTPTIGNAYSLSFNKSEHLYNWPILNDQAVLFIPDDASPNNPDETNFLIPVTQILNPIQDDVDGYISVRRINNEYQISGFQSGIGSTNTANKVVDINEGDRFYIRTYGYNDTLINPQWQLMRTNFIVTAPLTLSFGVLPEGTTSTNTFDAFRFLVGDVTGALLISPGYAAY
ncbi:hypothetical protein CAB17_13930 [Legionella sainthelensi]|uniref:Clostripain n=2 Tax=Legionella sainthelensi TaxID=28087 RepID=A0A2H5FNC5_9GAMM|nr:hypothetical protein CAB17_13930 [Legionella sainthelensi]